MITLYGCFHPLKNSLELHFMTLAAFIGYSMNYIMTILPPRQTAPATLDRIKWNSKPPSPQIKDEAVQKPRRLGGWGFIGEGGGQGGGTNFPSILSKTVGLRAMHELNIVL